MGKVKAVLGPYPPPYRGVELQAKLEFEKEKGSALFIGTSYEPQNTGNLILVRRGPFIKNGPQLFLKIWANKNKIREISAHYATTFGFLAYLAKKLFGIKYTVTCHGSDILVNMNKPVHKMLNNLALRNADEIFVVSKDLGAHLIELGYHYRDITHKPNKIDKKIFRKLGLKKKNQILFAGGIQHSKGVDLLVKAFAKIARKFPKYKLVLVGRVEQDGFKQELDDLIKEKKLGGKVIFEGEKTQQELSRIMNESKLFVMPSRTEGYGMALAEALACGLRAVSTNVGGLPEAGKHKNCVFVNPDEDELSEAIGKQLNRKK